jgi:hypothetical protein
MFDFLSRKKKSMCLGGDDTSVVDDAILAETLEKMGINLETWIITEMFKNRFFSAEDARNMINHGLLEMYVSTQIGLRYKSQRWDNCMSRFIATALQRVDWHWLSNWLKNEYPK